MVIFFFTRIPTRQRHVPHLSIFLLVYIHTHTHTHSLHAFSSSIIFNKAQIPFSPPKMFRLHRLSSGEGSHFPAIFFNPKVLFASLLLPVPILLHIPFIYMHTEVYTLAFTLRIHAFICLTFHHSRIFMPSSPCM